MGTLVHKMTGSSLLVDAGECGRGGLWWEEEDWRFVEVEGGGGLLERLR